MAAIRAPERPPAREHRRFRPPRHDRGGGAVGNSRLTGSTAAALLVLLAVEGATLLSIRSLISVHVFVGMLLVPPVALKLASTGYRFARYYSGGRAYRLAGPPKALLRTLGPVVVLSTLALFATGIGLIAIGPTGGALVGLHKASFVVWFLAMSAHVLGHLVKLPALAAPDWTRRARVPGSGIRRWLLAGSLVAGLLLAAATVHLAHPWTAYTAWQHHDG